MLHLVKGEVGLTGREEMTIYQPEVDIGLISRLENSVNVLQHVTTNSTLRILEPRLKKKKKLL